MVTYGELPLRGIAGFSRSLSNLYGKLLGYSTSVTFCGLLYHSGLHFVETGEFIRHIIFIIPSDDANTPRFQEFSLPDMSLRTLIQYSGSDSG